MKMKRLQATILLLITLSILFCVSDNSVQSIGNYIYYNRITVINDTATPVYSRIEVPVNAKLLIDRHYIQNDAEDIALTRSNNEQDITALDLGNNGVDWITQHFTVNAESNLILYMWYGDSSATRNQSWNADDGDTCTHADANSLDLTTVQIDADVTLTSTPSAGGDYLVNKQENYELFATGNTSCTWTFRLWEHIAPATYNRTPTANVSVQHTPVGAAQNWDCVNDPPPLGAGADGTYIRGNPGTTWTDRYFMADFPTTGSTTTIVVTDVSVYFRGRYVAVLSTARAGVRLAATTTWGISHNLALAFGDFSDTGLARPGGGDWTYADLNNIQGVIETTGGAGGTPDISQFYIQVTYYYADPHDVSIPAILDIERPLSASYNGTDIGITDGVNTDTAPLIVTTATSTYALHVCELNALVDNLDITNLGTATTVCSLDFEPIDIDATTITDHSASGNDITYALAAMDPALTVTTEGLIPQVTLVSAADQLLSADAIGIIGQPANFTTGEEDNVGENIGTIPDAFMTPLVEVSGVDSQWIWWFGFGLMNILIFIAMFRVTRNNLLFAWLGAMVITSLFVAYGPIPWWFIAFYVIGMISTLSLERRAGV